MIIQIRNSEFQNTPIGHQLAILHIIFFILLCCIDIVLLTQNSDKSPFLATKLIIDSIVTLSLITLSKKINNKLFNIALTTIKFTTLIAIVLIGNETILLVAFINEINSHPENNIEFIIQRVITKSGTLIVIMINQSMLTIVVVLLILLMEVGNLYFYLQSRQLTQDDNLISNLQSKTERESISHKENFWMNKIQHIPLGIMLFNRNLKILLANKICYEYFDTHSKDLEEFVKDKLQFQIVKSCTVYHYTQGEMMLLIQCHEIQIQKVSQYQSLIKNSL
ncbi:hypothetical protein FGO68_gene15209 [Halteria grandinella]|uniref:Uncharacterized protein n=1 Tax=Halteria grandinella TaxID=5974 RepID=A0A8J8NHM6_HALGN|nr:hypothetical protein FGO68_gene15209 [Halteria grandinella]